MLGIIRVISMDDEQAIAMHGNLIEQHYGIETVSACLPDQPKGIYDEETEQQSLPKIVQLARQLEQRGCTSIGISCAADPALELTRAQVQVPVYGAGSCAAHFALTAAHRIGVLTILEEVPPLIRSILGDAYIGMDRPDGVITTLDLLTPEGRAGAFAAASRLQAQGAQAIVLACTGFATIGFAAELRARTGLIAVDPILSMGAAAAVTGESSRQPLTTNS